MVDGREVVHAKDLFGRDVAEHGDFVLGGWVEWLWDEEAAGDLGRVSG